MTGLVSGFVKLYAYLMRFYPSGYQSEFGVERQGVLAEVLSEASIRGNWPLIYLVIRELRDFPISAIRANVREWEVMMKAIETKLGDNRFSWIGLFFGMWPFIFLGPVMAVLPYLPMKNAQGFTFYSPLWLTVVGLSILVGIYVGWRKGFPRWVYPYLVPLFFIIVVPLLGWLGPLLPNKMLPWMSIAFILIIILVIGAVVISLLNRFHLTRKIYLDVRNDWTRISFGMLVFLAFYTGIYMGDHLPPFGFGVLLPSLTVLFGAIVYLLSPNQLGRIIALIVTLGITLLIKSLPANEDAWSIWASLLMILILFSPVLIGLFPRRRLLLLDQ